MHSNSSTGGISRVRHSEGSQRLDTAVAKSFNITHLHPGTYHKRRDNCNMSSCSKFCFWMCNFHWLSVDTPVKTANFHKPRGLYEYSGNLKYCSVKWFLLSLRCEQNSDGRRCQLSTLHFCLLQGIFLKNVRNRPRILWMWVFYCVTTMYFFFHAMQRFPNFSWLSCQNMVMTLCTDISHVKRHSL